MISLSVPLNFITGKKTLWGGGLLPQIYAWWITVDHDTKRSQKSQLNIFQNLKELPLSYGLLAHGAAPHSLLIHRSFGTPTLGIPGCPQVPWRYPAQDLEHFGRRQTTHVVQRKDWQKNMGNLIENPWYQAGYQVDSLNKLPILILGNHLREANEGFDITVCCVRS